MHVVGATASQDAPEPAQAQLWQANEVTAIVQTQSATPTAERPGGHWVVVILDASAAQPTPPQLADFGANWDSMNAFTGRDNDAQSTLALQVAAAAHVIEYATKNAITRLHVITTEAKVDYMRLFQNEREDTDFPYAKGKPGVQPRERPPDLTENSGKYMQRMAYERMLPFYDHLRQAVMDRPASAHDYTSASQHDGPNLRATCVAKDNQTLEQREIIGHIRSLADTDANAEAAAQAGAPAL